MTDNEALSRLAGFPADLNIYRMFCPWCGAEFKVSYDREADTTPIPCAACGGYLIHAQEEEEKDVYL